MSNPISEGGAMKRAITWWIVNAACAGLLYVGYFLGVEGAKNLFLFLVWLNLLTCLCMLNGDVQKSIREKGRSVPAWISVGYDVAMVAVMVWIGLWFTASAFTLAAFLHNGVFMRDQKRPQP